MIRTAGSRAVAVARTDAICHDPPSERDCAFALFDLFRNLGNHRDRRFSLKPIVEKNSESKKMTVPGIRVGLGHDRHRLVSGRPLILGGIKIEFEMGLDGHSDADVLLHAVTDALLGAAGLGDIGEWFSNTDPQWANADSAVFLTQAVAEIRRQGWEIGNLDCTIHAERPKLSPHKQVIASHIAQLLEIDPTQVNVKAKTGEKVGPIGRQEAIDADAIVLLVRQTSVNESDRTQNAVR